MSLLTLDMKGVIAGLLLAAALLVVGRELALFFVFSMFWFLVVSSIVTRTGKEFKIKEHLYQKSRGAENVVANGVPPLIFAVLFYFASIYMAPIFSILIVIGYISSISAVTSDKFSSEIGVLDGRPRSLVNWKKVKRGVSGGVTGLGLGAGFAGAMLISLVLIPRPSIYSGINMAKAAVSVILAGFAGTLIDSLLGYFEEKGIGTKYSTNFFCGISGGILGMLFYLFV